MIEQQTAPEAAAKLRESARNSVRQSLRPPPRLSLPDWADAHRRLTRASGAVGGTWQTSRVEVARGPMMAVTEPGVRTITLKIATQLLKTEVLLNTVAFLAHTDPGPILYVLPNDEAVKSFSNEREATPIGQKNLPVPHQ
jgi:phage terminase large subunit GpA-like protein